ncbi:hypothetical protein PVK06_048586 [Gossypium arboreum]|uniref:Uncharacterized protein n=1 Tax=Gossypium arboreum TaxID=29729 RepID=A0ABR0MG88_GOSAR|nr:hypothetical protein PVK06_048586 [Gossypium arboreum]
MLSALEGRLVNLKEFIWNVREIIEVVEGHTIELDSMEEQLREFVLKFLNSNVEAIQRVFNSIVDKLIVRDDVLEAMIMALKEQIDELKRELVICKVALGNGMLAIVFKHNMDIPKPKEYTRTRSARDVHNFLEGMEQYFHVRGIMDDATKGAGLPIAIHDVRNH